MLPGVGPAPLDSFEPASPLDVFKRALVQGDLTGLSWLGCALRLDPPSWVIFSPRLFSGYDLLKLLSHHLFSNYCGNL